MRTTDAPHPNVVRGGVLLWLASWAPIPAWLGMTGTARVVMWTAQILIGWAGLVLAGSALAPAVKAAGWRRAPRVVWLVLAHGRLEPL